MAAQQPGIKRTDLQQHDLSIPLRPPMTRDAAGTLLGQTMGLVAVTAGLSSQGEIRGPNGPSTPADRAVPSALEAV
jgi:hypothetical protein